MYKLKLITFLILLSLIISGCGETVHGAGKDLKRMGEGIRRVFVKD